MAISVAPSNQRNTHHVKLTKSGTSIGLILADAKGDADPTAIQRGAYPNSAIHFYQGDKEFSDTEPPYRNVAQKDWSGGRGNIDFDEAENRYFDGYRANTLREGKVTLGGLEVYGTGYRSGDSFLPSTESLHDTMIYQALTGSQRYLAMQFTASATYTARHVQLWIRKVGTPGTLTVQLHTDASGEPGAGLGAATITASQVEGTLGVLYEFVANASLTSGTPYHVVVSGDSGDDAADHWEVMTSRNHTGDQSADGATWAAATNKAIYFRVIDLDDAQKFHFFEYKRALYAVSQPDSGGNSTIYMNGDRGAADSNAGNLDRLIDATKAWTADEWIGAIVLVTAGPGSEEAQPWRTIDDSTATALIVDTDWLVQHTTSTEYVIVDTDKWQALGTAPGAYVTDVAVTDDFVFFARGDRSTDPNILRYQEYSSAGTWTTRSIADFDKGVHLLAYNDPVEGSLLWVARNAHPFLNVAVIRVKVPAKWGECHDDIGTLVETETPWDAWSVANVTPSTDNGATKIAIGGAFTTGIAAVENLTEPVDITQARRLGMLINSSVATASGDLQLIYDDEPDLGKQYQPSGLKHAAVAAGVPTYADHDDAIDEADETYVAVTWAAADLLLVFSHVKFNKVHFDLGPTFNANAATLSAEYSSGDGFSAISGLSDGTVTAGATMAKDGDVTFTVPFDWHQATIDGLTGYVLALKVSANLTAGVNIREVYVERKHNATLNIPALAANEWTWVVMDITPTAYPLPDESAIQSIGLNVAVDNGAQDVSIFRGIKLIQRAPPAVTFPTNARINKLIGYSGSADSPRTNPWVLTEAGVYEIQTQNADAVVPLPLEELGEIRSEVNGLAATTNGVYLYFNLGQKVERYYNRQLDDIGPDLDEGLPDDRVGVPSRMLSFPGLVIMSVDADSAGFSSVLAYEGSGWHELYRAPRAGERIRDMIIQDIPSTVKRTRMWMSQGDDLLWMPLSANPQTDTAYRYAHEAALETSRFYVGMQDVEKFFKAVKLASENLTTSGDDVLVKMDYKLAGDAGWTEFADVFDTSPFEEVLLSAAYDKADRWVQLRLRLQTQNNTSTPEVIATVLVLIENVLVKRTFTLNFRLMKDDVNLLGERDDVDGDTKLTQLDTWLGQATPLLMNCFDPVYDTVYVKPEPDSMRTLKYFQDERRIIGRLLQMTFLQI